MIYIYIICLNFRYKFILQYYKLCQDIPSLSVFLTEKNIRFSQSLSMWTLGSKLGSKIRMGCGCGCHFRDKTALVVVFSQINGWIVCLFLVFFGVKFENFNIPDFFLRLSPQGWWIRQWNQEPQQLFLAPSSNVAFFDLYSLYLDLHWRPLDFQRTSDVCYFFRDFSSKCLRWIISSIDPLGHRRFMPLLQSLGPIISKSDFTHLKCPFWRHQKKVPFFVLCLCQAGDSNLFPSEGVFFPSKGVASHCFPNWWDDERETLRVHLDLLSKRRNGRGEKTATILVASC